MQQPPQMPQAYPPAPPMPVQPVQMQPVYQPQQMMENGGGFDGGGSGFAIPKELWIGFVFAFLTGIGMGWIYNERKKDKFPKLI